jgi:hypothetical protein
MWQLDVAGLIGRSLEFFDLLEVWHKLPHGYIERSREEEHVMKLHILLACLDRGNCDAREPHTRGKLQ